MQKNIAHWIRPYSKDPNVVGFIEAITASMNIPKIKMRCSHSQPNISKSIHGPWIPMVECYWLLLVKAKAPSARLILPQHVHKLSIGWLALSRTSWWKAEPFYVLGHVVQNWYKYSSASICTSPVYLDFIDRFFCSHKSQIIKFYNTCPPPPPLTACNSCVKITPWRFFGNRRRISCLQHSAHVHVRKWCQILANYVKFSNQKAWVSAGSPFFVVQNHWLVDTAYKIPM